MPGSFASRRSSCEGREGERLQVCDFQLRIRDDFQEDAAGILIDGFLHRLDIRQVPQARLDAEGHQGSGDERKRVPEQMPGGDDVLALRGDGEDGVADSRHAGIVPRYVGRPRQGAQKAYGGLSSVFSLSHLRFENDRKLRMRKLIIQNARKIRKYSLISDFRRIIFQNGQEKSVFAESENLDRYFETIYFPVFEWEL
jgi:hypothetical protein